MADTPTFEQPVLWSRVADAVRFWGTTTLADDPVFRGDETSCVVPISKMAGFRLVRDWLHNEFRNDYEMFGICFESESLKLKREYHMPFAIRFRFNNFDDKLLFTLRWV